GSEPLSSTARSWKVSAAIALLAVALGLAALAGSASFQQAGTPTGETNRNAEARRWFQDAKFGLFIHWGVYSLLGKGEWVMDRDLPLLLAARLAPPRLFPDGQDGPGRWTRGQGRVGALRRLLPGPGPGAMHQLRRDRWDLVRRLVGPARGRLGPRGHVPANPR